MGYYLYLKFLLNNILMLGILGQDLLDTLTASAQATILTDFFPISPYQPRLSNITNVAPGGTANQIAVFTVN
jgi:hypothetical protein